MKAGGFFLRGGEVNEQPYHYRGAGLEGIYLLNGFTIEDGAVSITDIDGLHHAIGRHIVRNRKGLSPAEIRFLRNTMGMTQSELAAMLGNNAQSVARWEKGECDIPGAAEKLLRAIFYAVKMTDEELDAFRKFLTTRMRELDETDQLKSPPAQFELFDSWAEKVAA